MTKKNLILKSNNEIGKILKQEKKYLQTDWTLAMYVSNSFSDTREKFSVVVLSTLHKIKAQNMWKIFPLVPSKKPLTREN